MTRFAPRKYFGNTIIFYFLFSVLGIIGLVFLSGAINNIGSVTKGEGLHLLGLSATQSFGLIFLLFSLLVISIMLIKNLAIGCYHLISNEGLIIAINGFKNKISFNEIININKIDNKEAEELMRDIRQKQLSSNPLEALKSINPSINLIKYCTVPITTKQVSIGVGGRIQTRLFAKVTSAKTSGDFILLTLKGEKKHLLSPKNTEGFISAIKNYIDSNPSNPTT